MIGLYIAGNCNDGLCGLPEIYRSREKMRQLLPLHTNYMGSVSADINYYVNIATVPGPADYVKAASLTGLNVQEYDNCLGTYNGTFYLNLGGSYVPVANTFFNLDNCGEYGQCTQHCETTATTIGRSRTDITGDNLFVNTYTKTKAYGGTGPVGFAIGTEYFYFVTKDTSHNCLTNINITTGLQTTMLCFYYTKIPSTSLKRSDEQTGLLNGLPVGVFPNDPLVTFVGKLKLPQSIISQSNRNYFDWVPNPDNKK
jgi:hypothetical protein